MPTTDWTPDRLDRLARALLPVVLPTTTSRQPQAPTTTRHAPQLRISRRHRDADR